MLQRNSFTLCFLTLTVFSYCCRTGCSLYVSSETSCMHYECDEKSGNCTSVLRVCDPPDAPNKRLHCYTAWHNSSGVVSIVVQGCWLDHSMCYDRENCVGYAVGQKPDTYYCCCDSSGCNAEFTYSESAAQTTVLPKLPDRLHPKPSPNQLVQVLLLSLGPLVLITVTVISLFLIWRCCQRPPQETLGDTPLLSPPSPRLGSPVPPVQLLELQAHGRFGSVYRATIPTTGETVAVKVFPGSDRQSWIAECSFYSLPFIGMHDGILRFYGAQQHGLDLWLITEFHERGSLYDYLKGDVVSWSQMITITTSMARGVAFLHSCVGSSKPPVVHRDLKSRNVLLKHNMTACVADFGLAAVLDNRMSDIHAQVGTKRYMAPEVLDGSINFSPEFILKIDIYAFSLILWELVSRCTAIDGPVGDYRMPFEDEVGLNPSLEDMQNVVVHKKFRPHLPMISGHKGSAIVCATIEDCWDNDPEARLSAECIYERMMLLNLPTSDIIPDDHLYPLDMSDSDKASRSTESSTCPV